MDEIRLNPLNKIRNAVFVETTQPEIPNYHIVARNTLHNQIRGDSGIFAKFKEMAE